MSAVELTEDRVRELIREETHPDSERAAEYAAVRAILAGQDIPDGLPPKSLALCETIQAFHCLSGTTEDGA